MNNFIKAGRCFYAIGVTAYGIQQIIIRDFRPEIVPEFPVWAHTYTIFPLITGIALLVCGVLISGLFKLKEASLENICLYLGFYFLALILVCHIPYLFFISPNKVTHMGVWAGALKELAFSGGAFVMAGSFNANNVTSANNNSFILLLKKLIPAGRIFFSTTMILFGYCHFLYVDFISLLVPGWFGMSHFWTWFGGTALIAAGIAIIFKIQIKTTGYLLAAMLLFWVIVLHVPRAIADPHTGNGNEIVSAFDALLFCGVALLIANSKKQRVPTVI